MVDINNSEEEEAIEDKSEAAPGKAEEVDTTLNEVEEVNKVDIIEDKVEEAVDWAVCGSEVNFSSMWKTSGDEEYPDVLSE